MKQRRIPELPGRRLGRHVRHDPRSRNFAVQAGDPATFVPVRHSRHVGIYDQRDLGACTGMAAAGALSTHPYTHHLHEPTALKLYSAATKLDPWSSSWPPDDTGSTGLAVAQALRDRGLIAEYRHAFDLTAALTALQAGPVLTGVNWWSAFDSPDPDGFVQAGGYVRGGHEFVVDSYLPTTPGQVSLTDVVGAANSWGSGWGASGRFHFTVGTWAALLDDDGDVTVLVP